MTRRVAGASAAARSGQASGGNGAANEPGDREVQAAVALALYLRAGQSPPASLVKASTRDAKTRVSVPSALVAPEWITARI